MIEIIQEENWDNLQDRKGLPKDVKQIGIPDMGDRIYIENSAYQKMHPYAQRTEKMVYVMLGHFDDFAGHTCIFVEDVIKMNEVAFNGKLPLWNDESWGYLYRKIRPEHENMIIVGWAVDICGQLPSMTAQLERIHQTYFGGMHQVLLLMDTLEREEAFFCNRNGYLKRREGFYIYYDRSIPDRMEAAIENLRTEAKGAREAVRYQEAETSHREESYREYLNKRNDDRYRRGGNYRGSYSSTLLLAAAILVLGYSAFLNHQKMESMERALNQIELQAVMQTETTQENAVRVEDVIGNVTPDSQIAADTQEQFSETEVQTTQTPIADISTQIEEVVTETITEAEGILSSGYYVVQSGDNLAGICRKIYRTTEMMDELCEANGIENPDAIYVGQRLKLPN